MTEEPVSRRDGATGGRPHWPPATKGEILSWGMYDFANSAYTTVVLTTIFNAYYVKVAANGETLPLTISLSIASLLIVLTAPIIGTIADSRACKKLLLGISTVVCIAGTAMLSQVGPGDYVLGMIMLIISNFAFGTGEDLIAAFLPELSTKDNIGRVSAFGWAIGYLGGLSTLGLCLLYVSWAQKQGQTSEVFVPITMLITAAFYTVGALPTFLFVKERALPEKNSDKMNFVAVGFSRLKQTLQHAMHYRDLFRFLIALLVYTCGTAIVIQLAALYAQEVMKFTAQESIILIFIVNITAAIGAFGIGFIQDKLGAVRTLAIALVMWTIATTLAYFCYDRTMFWVLANLIGLAMGASGSAGRALVGLFSPPGRTGEFFGLWGLSGKLAAAIGPLTYGVITQITNNNHRLALLSSSFFFLAGLAILFTVNEARGKEAAHPREVLNQ